MSTTLIRTSLAIALALAASVAAAHGDESHGPSAPAGGAHQGHGASIGEPGEASKASRTVNVDMSDAMRFNPASVEVKQGETIRFVVTNSGRLKHEFVLGTEAELKEHYELMKKFPEMEHADPNQVSLAPGKTGEVVWRFTRAGKVDFACLQPGHYDAGMKGMVRVKAGATAATQPSQPAASSTAMTEGEVRKIDKENRKITLRHGEIRNLEMPAMTMVFQVRDAAMLDTVKPGDKVQFRAEREAGALVVTDLQPAR